MKDKKEPVKKMNQWAVTALLVVVVSSVAFFGGMKYQQRRVGSMITTFRGAQGMNGQGLRGGMGAGNRMGFRPVTGEIVSADDKTVTVKMIDGSTKIVLLSETTTYNKAADGSKDDLKAGMQVGVFGVENSDGSLTAQNIQLNPVMRGGAQGKPQ